MTLSLLRLISRVCLQTIVIRRFVDVILLGVHSIERSAQEDTLLVLFNTALSNLVIKFSGSRITLVMLIRLHQVLFRNNFAMSRDIAGLFQSFQSSSTILDPAKNPTLFKSTLVIIIKVRSVLPPQSVVSHIKIGCCRFWQERDYQRVSSLSCHFYEIKCVKLTHSPFALQISAQVPKNSGSRTRSKFHKSPPWRQADDCSVACHRISSVLHTVPIREEDPRRTDHHSSKSWDLPANNEDADGKIKGESVLLIFIVAWLSECTGQRLGCSRP